MDLALVSPVIVPKRDKDAGCPPPETSGLLPEMDGPADQVMT